MWQISVQRRHIASSRSWIATGDGTTGTFHNSHSKWHASTRKPSDFVLCSSFELYQVPLRPACCLLPAGAGAGTIIVAQNKHTLFCPSDGTIQARMRKA